VNPARIGRYTVLEALGEGHFGAVWLAEGEVPGKGPRGGRFKKVAIKQLRGEWTMKGFETLVREFELLQRVHHRSLCKVYEFLDRESAVVMEYVEGATLRQVIEAFEGAREPVWPDAALAIGGELADCLYQSHATPGPTGEALGLVHRDLKPENVMLTPTGEVKVLDFGLARIDDGVREHGVKGTPLYMAPEQARGGTLDHRTDLFAVGLVIFELLTARAAYPIPSRDRESVIDALMSRIERADLGSDLHALKRSFPRAGEVVASCLEADPASRPGDGHVLLLELGRCIEHKGALAEFAAYAFGPVGPLASRGGTAKRATPAEAPARRPEARPSRSVRPSSRPS
jgi:serine/threonine protein kinase